MRRAFPIDPPAGLTVLLLLASTWAPILGQAVAQASPRAAPPRLVVLLTVDQLRADLLERYGDLFTGGLARLLEGGRVFEDATHDHAITETAPGHATLSTGTFPSKHGIVANQWWEDTDGRWTPVLNVVDPNTRIVGAPTLAGASPAKLERTGLADWLRAAYPDAGVVSISGKDRAAVLLAGRSVGSVFWFELELGRFATSTFYADREPDWVRAFNADVLPTLVGDSIWRSALDAGQAARTRGDSVPYEGDGVHTAFPHVFAAEAPASATAARPFWSWWASTPALDRATLLLAGRALEAEALGQDATPDLLAISLSATDRVGHGYGPFSREQLDNLLRLDGEIGRFFDLLDDRVGPDAWIVGFSSDHGALAAPEARAAQGLPGLRLTADSARTLQSILDEKGREVGLADPDLLADSLARAVARLPWVARTWTTRSLQVAEPADSFGVLERHSLYPGRPAGLLSRFGVEMQFEPFTLPWGYAFGTGHGSPYDYDRRVPFILMGQRVLPGRAAARVSTADLAPTLAALLGLDPPSDLDGEARPVR